MPRKLMTAVEDDLNMRLYLESVEKESSDEPDAPVEDSLVGGDEFDDDDDFEDFEEDGLPPTGFITDDEEPEEDPVEAAAPTAEAPSPVAEIEWDEAKERKADEEAWIESIRDARKEIEETKSKLNNLKERLKIAKADHALALQDLSDLVEQGPWYRKKPEPPKAPAPVPAAAAAPSPAAAHEEPEHEPKEPLVEVEDWQSITTASLLEGIDGLGAKKREALIEAFPTLGKLEEARGEASKQFKSFKEVLPRGIGEKIASELEEKMLQTIAKRTT